ncbi:hypothetical protein CH367_14215 [Leptospira barantonii]|uniref:DUF1566 domain-containing protein n=2 Tax=Leptospira barantonii TaxID=2023184 RepID=A0ABX4NIH3_9LEPT|nr:hypothetical protein CH367_14215 [Leptospira barantonii]
MNLNAKHSAINLVSKSFLIVGFSFLFSVSCLNDSFGDGVKMRFLFFPSSIQSPSDIFGLGNATPAQSALSVAGGKSLYSGSFYASKVASGDFGFNVILSFSNIPSGTSLRICLNDPGCGVQVLLYDSILSTGIANLNLNVTIPNTYPVSVGGNTLNFALYKDGQVVSQRSASLIYDSTAPTLSFSISSGSFTIQQDLSMTCLDAVSGCMDLIYTIDGQTPGLSLLSDFDPLNIVTGYIFPSTLNVGSGTTTVQVIASDRAGNISAPISATYTITIPPSSAPTVSLNSITNGTTNGSGSATSVNWTSDTAGNYFVVPNTTSCSSITPGVTIVSGTLGVAGTQDLTIPTGSFSEGANSLKLCLLDSSSQSGSFGFNVTIDTGIPTLVSTSPASAAVDIDVFNRELILTFNENMQPNTSLSPHVWITYGSGGTLTTLEITLPASATANWASSTVLKYDLDMILPEYTSIQVKFPVSGLKDIAGNSITGDGSGNLNLSYTTGGAVSLKTIIDTNQPGCFDSVGSAISCTGTGQDGAYTATPTAQVIGTPTTLGGYTNDAVTVDSTSGLTWKTCTQGMTWASGNCSGTPTELIWPDALSSCASLNEKNSGSGYAGLKNWRLASMEDIHTLITFPSATSGYLIVASASFPGFPSSALNQRFWSSTTYRPSNLNAFVIRNFGARAFTHSKNSANDGFPYLTLCVTGNP